MNKWITATIIFGVLCLGLICYSIYNNQEYNFDGVKISKVNYEKLLSQMKVGEVKLFCSLETNKCIPIKKLE